MAYSLNHFSLNSYSFIPILSQKKVLKASRYGFNGKMKDNEVEGEGDVYDFGARIYEPRLGRFLSRDPLSNSYPWFSPYIFAADNPIWGIDINGMGDKKANENDDVNAPLGQAKDGNYIHLNHDDAKKAMLKDKTDENYGLIQVNGQKYKVIYNPDYKNGSSLGEFQGIPASKDEVGSASNPDIKTATDEFGNPDASTKTSVINNVKLLSDVVGDKNMPNLNSDGQKNEANYSNADLSKETYKTKIRVIYAANGDPKSRYTAEKLVTEIAKQFKGVQVSAVEDKGKYPVKPGEVRINVFAFVDLNFQYIKK